MFSPRPFALLLTLCTPKIEANSRIELKISQKFCSLGIEAKEVLT